MRKSMCTASGKIKIEGFPSLASETIAEQIISGAELRQVTVVFSEIKF